MVTIQSKRWDEIPNGLELRDELHQFDKDSDYLEEHLHELLARYPDEFVAVHKGSVVAHGTTLDELMEGLNAAGPDATNAVVQFLSSKPKILLL